MALSTAFHVLLSRMVSVCVFQYHHMYCSTSDREYCALATGTVLDTTLYSVSNWDGLCILSTIDMYVQGELHVCTVQCRVNYTCVLYSAG